MPVHRLTTVDGWIVFDLDDCPVSAGGTRLAPDVTETEVALLARAMTYKFGVLEAAIGGAKAGLLGDTRNRDATMRAYCEEIRPMVDTGRFLTGPDLGTSEADFAPLRGDGWQHVVASVVDGVAFEDVLTGYGVASAAQAALGSLEGRSVAIEGFGKVGGGVAREVARRGGKVVAVSTVAGCVADPKGLDVESLWERRALRGDDWVRHDGHDPHPVDALFDVEADVLVPGARTGVIDRARASRVSVRVVVPAANVPYCAGATEVLHERGIAAHADFACNAGAVIGYRSAPTATPDEVLADVDRRISELVSEVSPHPAGAFAGACEMAEKFLRSWRGSDGLPPGPPLA